MRLLALIPAATVVAVLFAFVSAAQAAKEIYYWVSHGAPTDPVWTLFLQGAEQWAKDTGKRKGQGANLPQDHAGCPDQGK